MYKKVTLCERLCIYENNILELQCVHSHKLCMKATESTALMWYIIKKDIYLALAYKLMAL